jgi:hypothetical protein
VLQELSKEKGILGQIFTKAQNKIQDPAKLFKIIDLIDKESWVRMGAFEKGSETSRNRKGWHCPPYSYYGSTERARVCAVPSMSQVGIFCISLQAYG